MAAAWLGGWGRAACSSPTVGERPASKPEKESPMGDDTPAETAGLQAMRSYYENYPEVLKSYGMLVKYRPDVLDGYLTLRRAAFNDGPDSTLPLKVKELIVIAIECALMKTNPPPVGHAHRAIDAGATVEEIAEAVALCIPLTGMVTYQESGRFVIEAAEAYARERAERQDQA
jgi:alkylhydroperoxidase/carboxymuconolactone decarboxylase family protein YurZ